MDRFYTPKNLFFCTTKKADHVVERAMRDVGKRKNILESKGLMEAFPYLMGRPS
jgi:hypothetical protein